MIGFNRKPKNRRLERASVLDVKLRSSQVRAGRARMAAMAFGVLLGTVLGAFLLWRGCEWAMKVLVYENGAFALQELDVQTDGVIAQDQLRQWTGVRLGENLLALDLERVRRDLRMVSLVQSVSVERILPHTLRVRVVEREPIAQVNVLRPGAGGGITTTAFQLDAEGYVIVPLDHRLRAIPTSQTADQLPVLTGINPNEVQAGRKIDLRQVRAALDLVLAFEHSPMQGLVDLQSIDISAPEVLVANTSQRSQITFSLRDLDQQLRRWRSVFELGMQNNRAILNLDLAVSNSIPVVFQDASALPPTSPKPQKQLKRKHV